MQRSSASRRAAWLGLMLAWLIDPDATPDGQELLDAVIAAVGPLVEQRTESA